VARRRVRDEAQWRQPRLTGLDEQLARLAGPVTGSVAGPRAGAPPRPTRERAGRVVADDWEAACFRAACRDACTLAAEHLAAVEAALHAQRPTGYVMEGWRERTLVTRFGDVRVRRRRYRAPDGARHVLLDEALGWPPGQVATPAFATLLVDWATDVPFRAAARRVAEATAGAVSGSTAWRLLQQLATRVVAQEQATHATWKTTAALPAPAGERAVPVLYLEADGVWVKTQREPAHASGLELKCASMYEGWEWRAAPTPGHPRAHYRLREKQVYCHGFARADAKAPVPFWEAVDLALARTYDLSRVPLAVIGGDGANWLDTALASFPQAVRQRDGFHLARDAARGWGTEAGAALYEAVRAGDQATTGALLALPPPPPAVTATRPTRPAVALLPPPASQPATSAGAGTALATAPPGAPSTASTRGAWSARQVQRARAGFTSQVHAPDAAVAWRLQVPPAWVPPDARGLGTQEGTNAHLLAKRMKHKGMAWSAPGARHLAKARELVTNGGQATLATWCRRTTLARAAAPRAPGGFAPPGRLPWPQVRCPAAHGPLCDPTAAVFHRIDTGARARYRQT
jgi:hypothetical protein